MSKPKKLSSYFKHNIFFFQVTGAWVNMKNLKATPWLVSFYSITVNVLFILGPQICHFLYMYRARNNVKNFAEEFSVSVMSMMVVYKSYALVKYFDIICGLIESTDDKVFQPKNFKQITDTHRIMGTWKNIYWLYLNLVMLFCLMKVASPILHTLSTGTRHLPLVDCYPFNVFISPTYEFMFIYQSLALGWLAYRNVNVDTLVTGLLIFATAQCEILCDDLENLKQHGSQDQGKIIYAKMVRCIKHHRKIIRFVSKVEKCFSLVLFAQFACSVVTFCTSMFNLTLAEPMDEDFFTVIIYQSSCSLELFLFCWAASGLTVKSEQIPISAYQCDWIDSSKEFKSSLLMFMHNAQKPCLMMAVLFPVSIDIFIKILKSSFSYYAVLTKLNEK